jgi:hypothetical protein
MGESVTELVGVQTDDPSLGAPPLDHLPDAISAEASLHAQPQPLQGRVGVAVPDT